MPARAMRLGAGGRLGVAGLVCAAALLVAACEDGAGRSAAERSSADVGALIDAALAGEHRLDGRAARDRYRRPRETLAFFGLRPDMTVVEVSPGAGWYTEVLAPVLRGRGRLYAAQAALPDDAPKWYRDMQAGYLRRLAAEPVFDEVVATAFGAAEGIAPAGSADMALTFRNVHNWTKGGFAPAVFSAMHRALKPCGVLGLVEHRAVPGASLARMNESGYVTEAHVVALAQAAGFALVDRSEVNANPKDTADHPAGVWTLPPMLRLGERDRERYLAIGESDRMTLKFRRAHPTRCPADAG